MCGTSCFYVAGASISTQSSFPTYSPVTGSVKEKLTSTQREEQRLWTLSIPDESKVERCISITFFLLYIILSYFILFYVISVEFDRIFFNFNTTIFPPFPSHSHPLLPSLPLTPSLTALEKARRADQAKKAQEEEDRETLRQLAELSRKLQSVLHGVLCVVCCVVCCVCCVVMSFCVRRLCVV